MGIRAFRLLGFRILSLGLRAKSLGVQGFEGSAGITLKSLWTNSLNFSLGFVRFLISCLRVLAV